MPDPPWLRLARPLIGKDKEVNKPALATRIGELFPDMAPYCEQVCRELATAEQQNWCGLYLAYCLAQVGHKPPFKATRAGFARQHGFMRPFTWSIWGKPAWRLPGDVVVFDLGGFHHAAFYLGDNGDGSWACLGAAQGPDYTTCIWHYRGAFCVAVRRPHDFFSEEQQRVATGLSQAAQATQARVPIDAGTAQKRVDTA